MLRYRLKQQIHTIFIPWFYSYRRAIRFPFSRERIFRTNRSDEPLIRNRGWGWKKWSANLSKSTKINQGSSSDMNS